MNYLPIKEYADTNKKIKSETDNSHTIVKDILTELKNNISTLSYCLENDAGLMSVKSKAFSKSLTALYILQKSLNFEKGGEIAENLFKIYEFCRTSILEGYTKKDFKKISNLIPLIENILDGWSQIK